MELLRDANGEPSTETLGVDELSDLAAKSPALRLLRARSMPWVAAFLDELFLTSEEDALEGIPERIAHARLVKFQEENLQTPVEFPQATFTNWVNVNGWLRKRQRGSDIVYTLEPATRRALHALKQFRPVQEQNSDTQYQVFIDQVTQFVTYSTGDSALALEQLRQRRDELDAQIAELEEGGSVQWDPSEIRKRRSLLVQQGNQLTADIHSTSGRIADARVAGQAQILQDADQGIEHAIRLQSEFQEAVQSREGEAVSVVHELLGEGNFRALLDRLRESDSDEARSAYQQLRNLPSLWLSAASSAIEEQRKLTDALTDVARRANSSGDIGIVTAILDRIRAQLGARTDDYPYDQLRDITISDTYVRPLLPLNMTAAVRTAADTAPRAVAQPRKKPDPGNVFTPSIRARVLWRIKRALESQDYVELHKLLADHPPVDLAEVLTYLTATDLDFTSRYTDQPRKFVTWGSHGLWAPQVVYEKRV